MTQVEAMTRIFRLAIVAIACALLVSAPEASAQTSSIDAQRAPQINQPVNEEMRITLAGSKSPRAKEEYDSGAAPADLALSRMLLLLRPTRLQREQVEEYLHEVQDPAATN